MTFFNGKDIEKIETDVKKAAQKIKANADWMKKSFNNVNEWFENFEIKRKLNSSLSPNFQINDMFDF